MVLNAVLSSFAIISLRKREIVGCFALIVLWLSVFFVSSSRCHGLVHSLYWDISHLFFTRHHCYGQFSMLQHSY